MQSKGWIRLVAILLAVASLWQLSFTAVTAIQEKKAEKYAEKAAQAAQATAAFAQLPEDNQAFYLDSIRKEQNRYYIDSITDKKVYLWDTYKDVKAKEINLGLDLKGGMNVMLQVQLQDLVKALAGGNTTPEFLKALDLAKERSVSSREDYISLFAGAWSEVAGGARLSHIFGTYEMKDKIKPESTDAEVISVIRSEAESAIANSFNVLRNRIDRFGVTQPSIQKLGNSGRILVELPGVKEPERVRKLLQGTASLEFWETFNFEEIYPYLIEANAKLAEIYSDEPVAVAEEEEAQPAEPAAAAEPGVVGGEQLAGGKLLILSEISISQNGFQQGSTDFFIPAPAPSNPLRQSQIQLTHSGQFYGQLLKTTFPGSRLELPIPEVVVQYPIHGPIDFRSFLLRHVPAVKGQAACAGVFSFREAEKDALPIRVEIAEGGNLPHCVGHDLVQRVVLHIVEKPERLIVGTFVAQAQTMGSYQPILFGNPHRFGGDVAVRSFGNHDKLRPERARLLGETRELARPIVAAVGDVVLICRMHGTPVCNAAIGDGTHRARDGGGLCPVTNDLQEGLEVSALFEKHDLYRPRRRFYLAELVIRAG